MARAATSPSPSQAIQPPPRDVSVAGYAEALAYLDSRVNIERVRPTRAVAESFKLDRMRALMERLASPEHEIRFVHVAGSKGKGSVVEMLASCLSACGYATGVFTSPHLVEVRERIRVGDRMVSRAEFAGLIRRCAEASSSLSGSLGEVTYFETLTAAALLYFAEQAVDLAVVEVGLGGRLDSTNVIVPEVSVVTSLHLEHTEILGETLGEIAREKGGIIKPGVPAVSAPQASEAESVLREIAEKQGSHLSLLGDEDLAFTQRFVSGADRSPHVRVCVSSPHRSFDHMAVPLMGQHQAINAGLAMAALDRLSDRGFEAPEAKVAKGLSRTPSRGRLELVWETPRILIDGAHTPESVEGVVKGICAHLRYDSMVVIFGCGSDKKVDAMLRALSMGADKVIFTRSSANPRAADPAVLRHRFAELSSKMSQTADSVREAIRMAGRAVSKDDLICVTGSFYLAGEAKSLLDEARASKNHTR